MKMNFLNRCLLIAALGLMPAALTASPALACSACGCSPAEKPAEDKAEPAGDIVETAASAGTFTTLLAAAEAAGLVETLKNEGPLTVLAPTDAAFAKLPEGTVATLVKPENKATLTKILTYHVVAGRVTASDLVNQIKLGGGEYRIPTVAGPTLTARPSGEKIIITDAQDRVTAVTRANISTSNGVIHFTDGVFLPA